MQNNKRIIAFVYDTQMNYRLAREITDKMREKLNKFRKKVGDQQNGKKYGTVKKNFSKYIPISISMVIEKYPSNTCWVYGRRMTFISQLKIFRLTKISPY